MSQPYPYLNADRSQDRAAILAAAEKDAHRRVADSQFWTRTQPLTFDEAYETSLDWFERSADEWQRIAERAHRYEQMTLAERNVEDLRRRLECAEHANFYDFEHVARLKAQVHVASRELLREQLTAEIAAIDAKAEAARAAEVARRFPNYAEQAL